MSDDTDTYECIDCPDYTDIAYGDRVLELPTEPDEPLFCPYCGSQTLVDGPIDVE